MEKIDFIWFVEHFSRELDVACVVSVILEKNYSKKIKILPYSYPDPKKIMRKFYPKIVLLPYCYSIKDSALKNYLTIWSEAVYFNLAWEQVFYKANLDYKAPRDIFAKKYVIHHAWSVSRVKFLQKKGVPKELIFLNGHPAYKLYEEPYRNFFVSRLSLAKEFALNPEKKWVFFPENYSWFFYPKHQLEQIIRNGQNREIAYLMRDYCEKSFKEVIFWLETLSKRCREIEIVLRPRPAFSLDYFQHIVNKLSPSLSDNIHIIKNYSVREWILSSDLVISSFSTSLIEAAIAGKPSLMLEPFPLPPPLIASWYTYIEKIVNIDDFLQLCERRIDKPGSVKLKKWAQKELMLNNDPILGLVDFLGRLDSEDYRKEKKCIRRITGKLKRENIMHKYSNIIINNLGQFKRMVMEKILNYKLHEPDLDQQEIDRKVEIYKKFLS